VIHYLNKRFNDAGNVVDLKITGRVRSVTTKHNILIVPDAFIQSPVKHLEDFSMNLAIL
jgi:hypothetical protein